MLQGALSLPAVPEEALPRERAERGVAALPAAVEPVEVVEDHVGEEQALLRQEQVVVRQEPGQGDLLLAFSFFI